tara:strand:- start:6385 stop:7071 length:687 start_codon:yes stop_codon:yes gene_type:complete
MKIRNWIVGALMCVSSPLMASAAPEEGQIVKGWHTYDAMGCMLLQECKDGVKRVTKIQELQEKFPEYNWGIVGFEFEEMVKALEAVGSHVHLAPPKYFPRGHRGVYHTVSNHFYMNEAYVYRPAIFMAVLRHEGWHAAQDCMAGTIKNNLIAIIHPEEDVPTLYQDIVKNAYSNQPEAIPWEKEAYWAGHTEAMTLKALKSCASNTPMWETYPPTPLTSKWLEENGYK